VFDFDRENIRLNTNCEKYDYVKDYLGSDDVLPMWVADTDFLSPWFLQDTFSKRVTHSIYGYTKAGDSFYDSAIWWQKNEHNFLTSRDEYVQITGVVSGFCIAINAISNKDDEIIIQTPAYHYFYKSIELNDRVVLHNPLLFSDGIYSIDFDNLESIITKKTKAIILCNPHNPTGLVLDKDSLDKIADIAIKYNLVIISDEIHCDIVYKPNKHIPTATIKDIENRTITLISPSKTFNVAGLSTALAIIKDKKLRNNFIKEGAKSHSFSNNIFGLIALEKIYKEGREYKNQLIDYLSKNIEDLVLGLENTKIVPIIPQATYLVWLDFRAYGYSEKKLNNILIKQAKLGLSKGSDFGEIGNGFMRINIATTNKNIDIAIAKLKEFF
jgi:cystathionine beta-lyase